MILNSPTISGSLTVTGNIIASGSITLSGSVASASYASNAELLDGLDSTVFTLTSSFAAQTASFTAFTSSILSYTASQNILNGTYTLTSSFAAQTASFTAFTSSVNTFTASINSFSASVLSYTSSLNAKTSSFATTGSNTFAGIQTINSNLTVTGSITAQTLIVSTINATQSYSSGSNIFGNASSNTQTFTGSVNITGSLTVVTTGTEFQVTNTGVKFGNVITDAHSITGSISLSGSISTTGSATFTSADLATDGLGNVNIFTTDAAATGRGGSLAFGGGTTGGTSPYAFAKIEGIYDGTAAYNGAMLFSTNNGGTITERMRITPSGSVGIGTGNVLSWYNSGYTALQIGGMAGIFSNTSNTSITSALTLGYNIYVDSTGNYQYMNTTSARAGSTIVMDGGAISFNNAVAATSANPTLTTRMTIQADGNIVFPNNQTLKSTASSGYIAIYGNGGGLYFGGTTTNQIFLSSGGVLFIGATSITNSGSTMNVIGTSTSLPLSRFFVNVASSLSVPAARFDKYDNDTTTSQVYIDFTINNQQSGNGSITANGASQATFTTWSDIRLKENITNLPSQLSNIMALRPVEFDYKNGSGHQIGFIAQEVQEIYPDIVGENAEGYLTISGLSKMESRLIKAIQELKSQNDALQSRIETLESK